MRPISFPSVTRPSVMRPSVMRPSVMRTLLASAALSALATTFAAPAFAEDQAQATTPAEPSTGEIVVTAQRRAEKVTKVPISITVVDNKQLERQQVNTVNDLNRIAPSLEIQSAPGQNTGGGGSIRGIGTQTFSAGAVASVGVVVDQVSQGNANISDLFDIARVEVLKGPQGTLFGLTTSAGVINITTNKPEFGSYSARLRTELSGANFAGSQFGNQVVQGVVNIPLTSNAALRVSGFTNLRQGPDRNATTGKYDDIDTYGFRARLRWEPTDRLSINVNGDYSHTHSTNGGDFFTFVKTDGPGLIFGTFPDTTGITARLASCGVTSGYGNRDYCTSRTYSENAEALGTSLQVDYQAEPFTVTSITAYRHSSEKGYGAASDVFRADPLMLQVSNGPVDRPTDLVTQELRLSSPQGQTIEYTAGVFVSHQLQRRGAETLDVDVSAFGSVIPIVSSSTSAYRVTDDSLAAFGQATIHAADKLRLIGGLRVTDDRLVLKTYDYTTSTDPLTSTRLKVDKLSWRAGAQYDLTPKDMVYATASRGFKGGQIATPTGASPYVVQPEVPTAFELGVKGTVLRSLVYDANVFYEKIQGFQAQGCTVSAQAVISCVQSNIDGVKSRGAEIDLFGNVTRNLSLSTGFIWAKATYPTGYLGADGTNIGGTQLAYAPEYKFTLSGEYSHPVSANLTGFTGVDAVWKSRIRYEANSLTDTTMAPHWTVGGRMGLRTEDQRYSLSIFVRNLFNVHEPALMQSSFPYNGSADIGAIYGPQSFRQVGLSLDGKF